MKVTGAIVSCVFDTDKAKDRKIVKKKTSVLNFAVILE